MISQCVLVFKCPIEMLKGLCRHSPRPKYSISITTATTDRTCCELVSDFAVLDEF